MVDADRVLELERRLWNADADVYRDVLAENAVMVFPEPTGVLERDAVVDSLGDADRWKRLDVHDERVLDVGDDVVQVVYEADAERAADGSAYRALASSTYRRDGDDWLLVSHQQTPVDDRVHHDRRSQHLGSTPVSVERDCAIPRLFLALPG